MADVATPARRLDAPRHDGCRVLARSPAVRYLDGAEEVVHAMLGVAVDRSSLSDELHHAAHTWPERYHLDRGRANVLRALDLPAAATVLEVGAGCGALTRYLGETVAAVDAVEPVPARAAAARARTADLANVEVFVGDVDDVPDEAAYDLAVVVGVLEYVGAGSAADAPYVEFLGAIRRRLADGGALVLAIENQFGVKYLAGAPEDHTGRPWDGVHGYPHGAQARTFGRRRLERLLRLAGFDAHLVLGAFPDYKLTRVVLDAALAEAQPDLAVALPRMPSPDHRPTGSRPADERLLWSELVAGGDPGQHWNSFLVVAGTGGLPDGVWPAGRHAVYLNTDRAPGLCGRAEVVERDGGWSVHRAPLTAGSGDAGGVRLRTYREPVYHGPTLLDVLAEAPEHAVDRLREWVRLVETWWPRSGGATWDLVPQNVIVTGDGPVPIDLEWDVDGLAPADVLGRGFLLTADHLAARRWRGAGPATTVGHLASWLAVACGLDAGVVESAVAREAWFQAVRVTGSTDSAVLQRETENMRGALSRRLGEYVPEPGQAAPARMGSRP